MEFEESQNKEPIHEDYSLFSHDEDSEEDKKSHDNKIFTIVEEKKVVEMLRKFLEMGRPKQKSAIDAVCKRLEEIHIELKGTERKFARKFAYKVINSDPELWAKYYGDKKKKGSRETVSYERFNELRTVVDILVDKVNDLEEKIAKLSQNLAYLIGKISSTSLDSEQTNMLTPPSEYLDYSTDIPNPKSPSKFLK